MRKLLLLAALLAVAAHLRAQDSSVFTQRPNDPKAVYLNAPANGVTDVSAALQAAIDNVQAKANEGIVFVPSGRYRISRTIYVWPSVRIIGYGPTRPVFVLAPRTPGYRNNLGYMFFFAATRWFWKEESSRVNCQPGEVCPLMMPYCPP